MSRYEKETCSNYPIDPVYQLLNFIWALYLFICGSIGASPANTATNREIAQLKVPHVTIGLYA
ncbi:hypothetical protein [Xenorhabdus doucetiae]|uniref:Uncharacterized protein n=1 Tax=Xenorhabdus doucetiae TaxID=351671 RepID=A0ABY3NQE8_9GAMM|nr:MULTISPECIES: hypothetical protein [Xenorhabdus]MBD2783640.1 hypothetical protein [Xenorhabdus sp. 3]MBD2789687.1 hypothetical protein [Xenorhabdus sp. DI]TYP04081.1 hypothetical protein LY16_02255 [Xenorhabdus doucetiae]